MANIIDFGKKNLGNIIKVAAGAALLAAGVMGATHGKNDDIDDEYDDQEVVIETDEEEAEEPAEETEPEG